MDPSTPISISPERETAGQLEGGVLRVGSIDVRFHKEGNGDPILLLHGWGASISALAPLFPDLRSSYTVIAFDFPGHGMSDDPPAAWSVQDFAELTLGFMDAMSLQSPHIIAHSFGARVAIRLAVKWPSRVGKLIFVNGAGVRSPRRLRVAFRVWLMRFAKKVAPLLGSLGLRAKDWLYSRMASRDYLNAGSLRPTFVRIVNEDLTGELPAIRAKTLLVWGDHDTETPLASGQIMQRLIKGSRLVVLKNAGHYSYLDQYTRFSIEIKRFLREAS